MSSKPLRCFRHSTLQAAISLGSRGLLIVTLFVHHTDTILSDVFERLVENEPRSVMARSLVARTMMEVIMAPAELDELFARVFAFLQARVRSRLDRAGR